LGLARSKPNSVLIFTSFPPTSNTG
jgi:hypothetical protein